MKAEQKQMLKQAAAKMLQLHKENKEHEKRAHALRLIYKQAELGCGEVPRTHKDLQEKIASLLNEDLTVYEKAIELSGGYVKIGELGTSDPSISRNAEEQFQASILGEQF
jgi:hypothetical protein